MPRAKHHARFSVKTIPTGLFPDADGNITFLGSQGSMPFVVSRSATTTTLATSLNPSRYGLNVTYIATVQASGNVYEPTTGSVQFWCGSAWLGTASLNDSSQASLTLASPNCGKYAITAEYVGAASFLSRTSGAFTQRFVKNQAEVQLTCAMAEPTEQPGVRSAAMAAEVRVHRKVVFTILVHPAGAPAFSVTGGTVTIYRSDGRFVTTLPVRNGQAILSRYLCQVYQKSYYALYNGTSNLGKARSNMVEVTMSTVIAGAPKSSSAIVTKATPAGPKATLALVLANRAGLKTR